MRLRLLHVSTCAGLLALAACNAPAKSGTPAEETALRAIGAKYAEAFNKNDVAGMSAMVTEDYQAVSADGTVIKGRAQFEELEKKSVAQRTGLGLKLSVETTYLKWAGADHASLGGTWMMAGVPKGMGVADKGAWTMLAEKGADGQWRLATGLVADSVPPPAMPDMNATMPAPSPAPAKGKGK